MYSLHTQTENKQHNSNLLNAEAVQSITGMNGPSHLTTISLYSMCQVYINLQYNRKPDCISANIGNQFNIVIYSNVESTKQSSGAGLE